MPKLSANGNGVSSVNVATQSSAPSTPSSGNYQFYVLTSDDKPYGKNDSGTVHKLSEAINSVTDLTVVTLAAATELTIATGAVTKTQTSHTIDTEADAASDDLDTISGGTANELIWIRANNTARTVVVKHATGNIYLRGAADISLDSTEKGLMLFYDGTNWIEV